MNELQSMRAGKDRTVSFIQKEIQYVCQKLKPRTPGSDGEREAARYMADLLRKECGCEYVRTESFEEHPDGFYGYLYFSAVLDLLCCGFFFIVPWLSAVFGLCAVLLMIFQFVLYHEVVDRFFPKKTGTNVTALRPCSGEVKRRVFLNGHIDSAWEWRLSYYCNGILFEAHSVGTVIGILYYLFLCCCYYGDAGAWVRNAGFAGLVFVPLWIGLVFLRDRKRTVDGANDDLTGCFIGISLLKAMKDSGAELKNTETGVILTGSEECGLRGAKAWCKAHRQEYSDVPTYIICIDTIHHPQNLMSNERDLNGTVKCDQAMSDLIRESAAELGLPCRKGSVPFMGGATDSAAFVQGGFRSVGITGLDHQLEPYYHTRRDTWDNLDLNGIGNCFEILTRTLEKIGDGALDE